MNFNTAHQQLNEDHRILSMQWKKLKDQWKDSKTTEFEHDFITPLSRQIFIALESLNELESTFKQLKEECGGWEDF